MKNKGLFLILITMGITLLLWMLAVPSEEITTLDRARHIVAGLSLSGLFLVFVLSTRKKWIESWFNGLDKAYVYHKDLSIFSIILLLVHAALSDVIKEVTVANNQSLSASIGDLALFLFVILSLVALFDKRLHYEKWRLFHRLMVIPYVFGLYHAYTSSKYDLLALSPLGIWTGLTALIGLASAIYIIFFYQSTQFKFRGTVTTLNRLSSRVIEIGITLDHPIEYSQGQYVFVKVFQQGIETAPHPFSISGGSGSQIRLTVKASGDFTKQLYDSLEVGTKVTLEGPHGYMDFGRGKKNQLWIAGGIGITPFIAYLEENEIDQNVDFFYSYRGQDECIYREFLTAYQERNEHLQVTFVDTSEMKRMDFEDYVLKEDSSIFMCGPTKMMKDYVEFFKNRDNHTDIVYEYFNFR